MNGWATVSILGILGSDAEVRATSSGKTVTNLRVAVTRYWKDAQGNKKEDTSWIRCTDWGKRPDWLIQRLSKGTPVAIQGRLQEESWEKDGQKQHRMVVYVENIEPLSKPQYNGERRFQDNSGSIQTAAQPDNSDEIPF